MNIIYRRFLLEDASSLFNLSNDEWRVNHILISKSLQHSYNDEICCVALSEEKIVGYVDGFVLSNKTLIPHFLYVLPEYRTRGIGQGLLKKLEEESGCQCSMIYYNKTLHNYYENQGYSSGDNLEVAIKDIF